MQAFSCRYPFTYSPYFKQRIMRPAKKCFLVGLIIFIFQPQNEDFFGQTKKEDDYFLVTPFFFIILRIKIGL